MRYLRSPFVAAVIGSVLALGALTPAHAITFANTTPITIPDSGAANPYPSNIAVSGVTGTVTGVTVTLFGYSHTYTNDVDVLLVGPQGQNVALMFGAGDSTLGTTATNIDLTFSDAAASQLPDEDGTPALSSGTYLPSNFYPSDTMVSPAPAGPYGSTMSVFNGAVANGIWNLYVEDFAAGDSGSISGGWNISLTTAVVVPESGTFALLGLGALPLAGIAYRRMRHSKTLRVY